MNEAVDVVTALSVRATESKSCIDSKTPPLGKKGSYAKDLNHLEEPCCIRPKNMGWVQVGHYAGARQICCIRPEYMGRVKCNEIKMMQFVRIHASLSNSVTLTYADSFQINETPHLNLPFLGQ